MLTVSCTAIASCLSTACPTSTAFRIDCFAQLDCFLLLDCFRIDCFSVFDCFSKLGCFLLFGCYLNLECLLRLWLLLTWICHVLMVSMGCLSFHGNLLMDMLRVGWDLFFSLIDQKPLCSEMICCARPGRLSESMSCSDVWHCFCCPAFSFQGIDPDEDDQFSEKDILKVMLLNDTLLTGTTKLVSCMTT